MKRIVINILLSILILFSNSGWAVTFHYCQDQLASVSLDYASALIVEDDDACATMDDCCGGDENVVITLQLPLRLLIVLR